MGHPSTSAPQSATAFTIKLKSKPLLNIHVNQGLVGTNKK
jgi:hypothetical protein